MDALKLSLVPDVVIPHKFMMPDFVNYNGSISPKAHMTMFYHKMARHIGNDKVLIQCFQESLIGSTVRWYMKLDRSQIHTWINLVKAFLD